jgi:hypothetical protein
VIALVMAIVVVASMILLRHTGPCKLQRRGGLACQLVDAVPSVDRAQGLVAKPNGLRV